MKRRLLIIALFFAIAAAAYSGIHYLKNGTQNNRFTTTIADRGDIRQVVSASGTLNPVKLVNVGTQISGVVQALHADFNDTVQAGQILAELDQSLLNAQLEQSQGTLANAQAELKLAEADYRRDQALYEKKFIAKADLDKTVQEKETALAQVKTAQGQVDRDKVNLSYTVIRSPVSGVVISRQVDIGQTVAASFQTPTLFQIAQDLKQMEIDTNLSEADVGSVKEKMPVRFTVDAFPGRSFEGSVRQIRLNPTNVQNVVTYNVVIDVSNDDLSLLPGMTAFVTLIVAEHDDVLRIPNAALTFRLSDKKPDQAKRKPAESGNTAPPEMRSAYVLKDGNPVRAKIKPGISDGKFTEVVEGDVREGDLVVTEDNAAQRKPAAAGGGSRAGGLGGLGGLR